MKIWTLLLALNSHFLLLDMQARLMTLLKKRSDFHQNQIRGSNACKGENLQVLYIMNLNSLVAFENFKWLLITPAVICNNCTFTKQYWKNILGNEFLGGDIWTLPAILSHVRCQWKVCCNKLKQGNFKKTDVGGESQDICQELKVTSGHTKSFFSKIFGRFLKTWQ